MLRAEKSAKSHVFGSVSASIILHMIYKSLIDEYGGLGKYALFHLKMFVFNSSLVFLIRI